MTLESNSSKSANVVIDLIGAKPMAVDQLFQLLASTDEGMPCAYHLQLPICRLPPFLMQTLIDFMDGREVYLSTSLPSIGFPDEAVDDEVEAQANASFLTKSQRRAMFDHSLCMLKYGRALSSFFFMDAKSVVLRDGWLQTLHLEKTKANQPVFGYLRYCVLSGKLFPRCWSSVAWYDGAVLRAILSEEVFTQRSNNPFWAVKEIAAGADGDPCFSTPWLSAYDLPFEVLYFALLMKHRCGPDIKYWDVTGLANRGDLFVSVDPCAQSKAEATPQSALFCGIPAPEIAEPFLRQRFIERGRSVLGQYPPKLPSYPLSGPRYSLIGSNDRRLEIGDLKDLFLGQRCFIIGNGPSLNQTDLMPLKHEYTIGLNRIYLNYEYMGFEPTFLCIANPNVVEQFHDDVDQLQSLKFIRYDVKGFIRNRWNTFFMESYGYHDFNTDLSDLRWCEGTTVTYCAMQLAFYLGFAEVILVGVDHHFALSGTPHKLVTASNDDQNHFHPHYFGRGIKWQYPDLVRSEISYRMAKTEYQKHGRRILDATINGHLSVFPKIDFRTLFGNANQDEMVNCLEPTGFGELQPAENVSSRRRVRRISGKIESQIFCPSHENVPPSVAPQSSHTPYAVRVAGPQSETEGDQMILSSWVPRFKDIHAGQRCVIIGNGPSLNRMDLSFLEKETTFGLNRIYLLFEKWKFRPTYYVAVNPLVIEQSAAEIQGLGGTKFISDCGRQCLEVSEGLHFIHKDHSWHFSKNPETGLCEGWTVTFVAMQLAYHMGFKEVVLIGIDHHFITKGEPNEAVVSEGDDPNHFHPEYFGKGVRWHLPDLERSEISYRMAKQAFESDGRRILDATVDGRLNVFSKVDYREYFKTPFSSVEWGSQHTGTDALLALKHAQELVDSGKLDEAGTLLETAIADLSQEGSLHFARGLLHERCGEPGRAIESFAAAVRLAPENPNYLKCLARHYHETCGKSVEALGLLRQSFEKDTDDPSIHQLIGEILHALGRVEEARYFRETAERLICEGHSQRVRMDSTRELRFYHPESQTAL